MRYAESPTFAEAHDLDAVSDQPFPQRPARPSMRSPRSSGLRIDRVVSNRPSVGRRIFRAVTRFLIAVLIGVGGTLAWQSRGDAVREMVVARAPTMAWLLSVSMAAPAVAATSPDPVQLLAPLASSLDAVRRSIDLLAARQDQMAQTIAKLQAVEEDIRQTMSSPAPAQPQQAAPIPQHKPQQPKAPSSAVQSSVSGPPPAAGPLLLTR
jgi:hypothetical protein